MNGLSDRLLLEHLREQGPPDTQSDIEEVQTFVLKQTANVHYAK